MYESFIKKLSNIRLFLSFLIDFLVKKRKIKNSKVCWCAPFPPVQSGGAFYSQQIINIVKKYKLDIFYLPVQFMNNPLFSFIINKIITHNFFDYVILFTSWRYNKVIKLYSRKIIIYDTCHKPINYAKDIKREREFIEEYKNSDMVVLSTKWSYKAYKNYFKCLSYVPLGVDMDFFCPKKITNDQPFQVLFVSRLCYYKGIVQFLESIPQVLKKYPNTIFKIVGDIDTNLNFYYPNNSVEDTVEEITEKLVYYKMKFNKNIVHLRYLSHLDLANIYQTSHVLVFPSCSEGFGLPIIEAMACEIPVIAFDNAPMTELIKNKIDGLLIKSRKNYAPYGLKLPHPNDIAKQIIWMIEHPKDRSNMGVKARIKVLRYYDINKNLIKLLDNVKKIGD